MNIIEVYKNGILTNEYYGKINVDFRGDNSRVIVREPNFPLIKQFNVRCDSNACVTISENLAVQGALNIWAGNGSNIEIGKNACIGEMLITLADEPYMHFEMGNDCLVSHGVLIRASDGHTIYDQNTGQVLNTGGGGGGGENRKSCVAWTKCNNAETLQSQR